MNRHDVKQLIRQYYRYVRWSALGVLFLLFGVFLALGRSDIPWVEDQRDWFLDLSKAFLVVTIIGVLIEIPVWAGYFEQRVSQVLRGDLLERLDRQTLREFRDSVDRRLYKFSDPELASALLEMMDENVYPTLESPAARDFELHRTVREVALEGNNLLQAETKVQFTLIAGSTSPAKYDHDVVTTTLRMIPGIPAEQLLTDAVLKFDGVEEPGYRFEPEISEDQNWVIFRAPPKEKVFNTQLTVEWKSTRLISPGEPYTFWMPRVVHTVRVHFHFPQGWVGYLEFLAIGPATRKEWVRDEKEGYIYAVFDGLMLPGHGILLDCYKPPSSRDEGPLQVAARA